jgi:plastocyanin
MSESKFVAVILAMGSLTAMPAADIEGTIIVKRQLTRRTVTPSPLVYHRGPAVELAANGDAESDTLAYERSHVAIYLEGKLPATPIQAVMKQKNRRFVPDLHVIPAGSTVTFPNLDVIFHNVFSLSKARTFDLGNYPRNQTRLVKFSKPGVVFVNCHLHPNMGATILVTPNSWGTIADRSGRFLLADIPAGEYTVVAWHKTAGYFRQKVVLGPQDRAEIEFLIPFTAGGISPPLSE